MFTVTREGTIKTDKRASNQCNYEGCTEYRYVIDVTTDERIIPATGFAIDHNDLDRIAREYSAVDSTSCELMAWNIAERVAVFCKEKSINLLAISVQIRPIEGHAYVTLKRINPDGHPVIKMNV